MYSSNMFYPNICVENWHDPITIEFTLPVKGVAFAPRKKHQLAVGLLRGVKLLDLSNNIPTNFPINDMIRAIAYNHDENLAIGMWTTQYASIIVYDSDNQYSFSRPIPLSFSSIAYDHTGKLVVASNIVDLFQQKNEVQIKVFDYRNIDPNDPNITFPTHILPLETPGFVQSIAFNPDNILAVATTSFIPALGKEFNYISLFDLQLGGDNPFLFKTISLDIQGDIEGIDGKVEAITFGPQGYLAAGTSKGTIYFWDIRELELKLIQTLRVKGSITSLSWKADGSKFAAGLLDGRVIIWG